MQEEVPLLSEGAQSLAQIRQQRRHIDACELALFLARLQARETGDVIQQVMQGADVALEHLQYLIGGGLAQPHRCQAGRRVGHHAEIAAQIVRRLAPQLRPFEFAEMAGGLALLEMEELRGTLLDRGAAKRRPHAPRRGHHARLEACIRAGELIELDHHGFVEPAKLARHLAQIIALVPALQAVCGAVVMSGFGRAHRVVGRGRQRRGWRRS